MKNMFVPKWKKAFSIIAVMSMVIGVSIALGEIVISGGVALGANQTSLGFKQLSLCGPTGKSLCKVGVMGPGGGTIFFVDYNDIYSTFNYLEAAPLGWSLGSKTGDPALQWCSDITHLIESTTNEWTSRTVGQGEINSAVMVSACTSGAANEVDGFNHSKANKYSDWFLPSLGELIILTENLQGLAGLTSSDYWSSSEYSDVGGWVQSVNHGYQGTATKNTTFKVRPIRSF